MAEMTPSLNSLQQVRLVAGLRWRILRNSLRNKNKMFDLIGLFFAGIFSGVLVLGLAFAFYSGTHYFLSSGRTHGLVLLFWAIFLFWQFFPIFVAGFGASFEFRTLLRFPFSLRAFYLLGLAYGFANFSALASLSWLFAMTLGAAAAMPRELPAMLAAVALFVLMNVTLERLAGSWLERILARRRSREFFVGFFLLAMISLQFLGPLTDRYLNNPHSSVLRTLPYFAPFPPSLAGRVIAGAARHDYSDVVLGIAGLTLFVLLFSALLWRRFAAQYRGEEWSEAPAPVPASRIHARKELERDTLLLLSPQVAAFVHKELRYVTRNGFALLLLAMPLMLMVLFTSQFAGRHPHVGGIALGADLFFPAMMGYLVLILMAPSYNNFAYEGRGIQTYFTAPIRFREVFLAKNLMLVVILVAELSLSITVLAFWIGVPSPPFFFATLAAIIFFVAGQLPIANWSSLCFPRKLEFGSLRGQRNSGVAVWIMFAVQIVFGGACALVLSIGRWTGNFWLPAEIFAVLAAAAIGGYFASLDALSHVAEKKKEVLTEALCR